MTVKTYIAVSALALIAAGSAFAAEGTQEFTDAKALSTKSRAEVVAEMQSAPAVGEVSPAPVAYSTLLRARVRAEAREAQRLGLTGPSETLPQPTAAQLEQIRVAGERAVATALAAAKRQ